MLFRAAGFSGVEILTYCLMANHFHVLVKVPDKSKIKLTDEELIARYRILYKEDRELRESERAIRYEPPEPEEVAEILKRGGERAEKMRASLLVRMHDLSQFMKTFKQRFAIWLNVHRKRFGPVWNERFVSVLVEPGSRALLTVAAYIELNPVRAGLVDDPGNYAFSGYGEAQSHKAVRPGMRELIKLYNPNVSGHVSCFLEEYGNFLLGRGSIAKAGKGAVGELSELSAFLANRPAEKESVWRHMVAPLNRGLVVGTLDFVRGVWETFAGEMGLATNSPPKESVFAEVSSSKRRFWKK
ncbi:MAG: hypothetical protein LAT55_01695 [Opitutales bacterium]|nr:hypothetical protein [Opitutales bacterium]